MADGRRWSPSSAASNYSAHRRTSSTPSRLLRHEDHGKNFKVVVRVRPPLPRELEEEYADVVHCDGQRGSIAISEVPLNTIDSSSPYAVHRFTFDHVYGQGCSQRSIYESSAKQVVLSVLQGYNSTVLAYGQTGTGKTFTMEGFDDDALRGITPRSVGEIFNYIQNTADSKTRFLVRASYLQIYNEIISDLLKPERTNLMIREDKRKGVFVEGLSEWVVRSPDEVYGLIKKGSSIRATGATRLNEISSRSHALFIIIVEQNELQSHPVSHSSSKLNEQNYTQSFKVGKLNLVDLAGSERVSISGATGRRLDETKKINQSLSALGNVISALTERSARSHIPYRNSKLTRILEDSLGGNCKTTFIAMVSPAQQSFLESLSTLKFANRAKNIKNQAVINENVDEKALLYRYELELKKLRNQLAQRRQNVVDKRALIEVEEQRRQAEQDKITALMNMEKLSRDLVYEKMQKKQLEERIQEMSSQLLVGGHAMFEKVLQREQDKIRKAYLAQVAELEKERKHMEHEKVQTHKYKQLLLKQRDIMIQLTARLNERDQTIRHLQEELDAYDAHQRVMEDALDTKTASLISLQKKNFENPSSQSSPSVSLRDSKNHEVLEAVFELQTKNEENKLLRQELENIKTSRMSQNSEVDELRGEKANLLSQLSRAVQITSSLKNQNSQLLSKLENAKRPIASLSKVESPSVQSQKVLREKEQLVADYRDAISTLRKKCSIQVKERTALKTILENKIKVLVDNVAMAAGANNRGLESELLPSKASKDLRTLQRIIVASLAALDQADNSS